MTGIPHTFIFGALTFLGGICLCFAGVYTYNAVVVLQDDVLAQVEHVANMRDRGNYAASVRAVLKDTERDRATLATLASERDIVAVITAVRDSAESVGVPLSVETVSPVGVYTPHPLLDMYSVVLRTEGSREEVHTALAVLETVPYLSSIEQVILENTDGVWTGIYTVRVYLERESTPVTENL